jgi:diaminobutyrate-2-oxoglutarate transaminase
MMKNLHFTEYPIIKTEIPGTNSKKLIQSQSELESSNVSYPKALPIAWKRAKGATIEDADENIFFDFFSSAGVVNAGHNNPYIEDAVKSTINHPNHCLDFPTETKQIFIKKLLSLLAEDERNNYKINFGGPTGSDAIEASVKLAKINTGRNSVISFQGCYHGMTGVALSLTSKKSHKVNFQPALPVDFMPYAYCYRCPMYKKPDNCDFECAKYVRECIENPHSGIEKPAAIILEPIQAEAGNLIPKSGWHKEIANIAKDHEIPLIFDEIQIGNFRTGKFLASQHFGVMADIIALSKGIGGSGYPISLILFRKQLDKWGPGTHIGTFRANQNAIIAGNASLNFMTENNIESHISKLSVIFQEGLAEAEKVCEFIGEYRGIGLLYAIEFVKNKKTKEPAADFAKKVKNGCFNKGIMMEIGGHYDNTLRILPPLTITEKMAKVAMEIIIETCASLK